MWENSCKVKYVVVLFEGGKADLLLKHKCFAQLVLQKASFAAGFSCSPPGALLVLREGPNFGISLKLLLFSSFVRQEAAWEKVGARLRISTPCSGVSWDDAAFMTRHVSKAETCLDNLVVLEIKIGLACSTVSVVGLYKSDLKAHLLVSEHCSYECCSSASCWGAFRGELGPVARRCPL